MINSVRNTVLSILNKNNYGYISPSDFNLFAKQAQMELFEEYFSSYNKIISMENSRLSGVDYANLRKTYEEAMEVFYVNNTLTQSVNNVYSLPSLTTTGDEYYMIDKMLVYKVLLTAGTASSASPLSPLLIDTTVDFLALCVAADDLVVNTATGQTAKVIAVTSTQLTLTGIIFPSADGYLIYDASYIAQADKISHSRSTLLNNSLLTAPTLSFPSYVQQYDIAILWPNTINQLGQVEAYYFRYPLDPKWTYISLTNGEPAFDQSQPDYQDFELPVEDEYKLVMKILQYCGVSIRENEVVSFGMAQEQHEEPSFSVQQ